MNTHIVAVAAFQLRQEVAGIRSRCEAHVGKARCCPQPVVPGHERVLRSVHEIFSIIGRQRIVIDLVDETIDFLLDEPAVFVGVRIVRRVDRLLLEGL